MSDGTESRLLGEEVRLERWALCCRPSVGRIDQEKEGVHAQKGTGNRELRIPEWQEGSGQTTEGLCRHPAMSRLHSFWQLGVIEGSRHGSVAIIAPFSSLELPVTMGQSGFCSYLVSKLAGTGGASLGGC